MPQPNELSLFEFHAPGPASFPTEWAPLAEGVDYRAFRGGGRDGIMWRSEGVWLMLEAAPVILPGGAITGERRRLLIAAGGFAPDPETGRMTPVGPVAAEYTDRDELPEAVAIIVREAAQAQGLGWEAHL